MFENITLLSKTSTVLTNYDNVSCINFDLTKSHEIPTQSDIILHLASVVPYNNDLPITNDVLTENLCMFHNLMRYSVCVGAKHVILISSTDIFPIKVDYVIRQETIPSPHNEYGLSKLLCEKVGTMYSLTYQLPLTILRFGPIYCEELVDSAKVTKMLCMLRKNQPVNVYNPCNVSSLLHVESAVDAIIKSFSSNIGNFFVTGPPLSDRDFFTTAKKSYNSSSQINFNETTHKTIDIAFDLSNSKSGLGWEPYPINLMFNKNNN